MFLIYYSMSSDPNPGDLVFYKESLPGTVQIYKGYYLGQPKNREFTAMYVTRVISTLNYNKEQEKKS